MIGMKREGKRGGKKVGGRRAKKRGQENPVMVGGGVKWAGWVPQEANEWSTGDAVKRSGPERHRRFDEVQPGSSPALS
jgi:hypothetical protein